MDIGEKLSTIKKEILDEVEEETEQKLEKEKQKMEHEYEELKHDVESRKQKIITTYKQQAKKKREQIISKGTLNSKKKKMKKKQELFNQLLQKLEERLNFRKDDDYAQFLKKLIRNAIILLETNEIYLEFNAEDREIYVTELEADIKDEFTEHEIVVKNDYADIKGGVIAKSSNGREIIQNDFSTLIEEYKEEIMKEFQIRISR